MKMRHLRLVTFCTAAAMLLMFSCGKNEGDVDQPADTIPDVPTDTIPEEIPDNIYQFKVLDGNNDSVPLSLYEGQVLLVVNTATECGYTPQYEDLERIYRNFRDQGFTILDFPCNQFGGQAPGDYDQIHSFCTSRYNITFPQFAKIMVNGSNAEPLYVWLKSKKPGEIQWNFTKFVIDREGNVVRRFEPSNPMSAVESAVRKLL